MTELTLNVSKVIDAPIEKVFNAWLDPKILAQFMMPMPGMPNSDVENDAREGGGFTIVMHAGDNDLPHTGKYIEINKPHKLVFTWESHRSVDHSIVTLNFTEVSKDKTNIELSHVKFVDEEACFDHEKGWSNILSALSNITLGE